VNDWEVLEYELGDRVAHGMAREVLYHAHLKKKREEWEKRLTIKVMPKGVNVSSTEVRHRRTKNKAARKARRRNR
jgi:hypothetical protein